MNKILTKYGTIHGLCTLDSYVNGSLKECKLNERNEIKTIYGVFIPQYTEDEARRKYVTSLSFYENGNVRTIALQEQAKINTKYGILSAELITFYETGEIKRIFPLNGKITGYWTEENEYNICEEFQFIFNFANFKKRIIGANFYKSGYIKSLTFWPKDSIDVQTSSCLCSVRIGISLYENGYLKSFEPKNPTLIKTPIGSINAYNVNALGINGDKNSLNFYEDGRIKSLITSTDRINITDKSNNSFIYEPSLKHNLFNNNIMDIVPLSVDFIDSKVIINKDNENYYDIKNYFFSIEHFVKQVNISTSGCSNCKI